MGAFLFWCSEAVFSLTFEWGNRGDMDREGEGDGEG